MRATLNATRAGAGAIAAGAQKHVEDTIDIVRYLVLYTYLAGLILALPVGWLGDYLGWAYQPWVPQGISYALRYLGYLPGAIAFVAVSFFWWDFEAHALAAEALIQALPEWFRTRAMKWSMKEGFTYKFFYDNSMVGLWMPVLLWVPAEFPVWRHPIHYVGMVAVAMAVTQFVATRKDAPPVWRRRYMFVVGLFALRHLAGFAGYNVEGAWASVGQYSLGSSSIGSTELLFIAAAMVIIAMMFGGKKETASHSTS